MGAGPLARAAGRQRTNPHRSLQAADRGPGRDRRIVPAGEWLLDNFYLIEEQIRTARRHLPEGYSRELPRLSSGPSTGLPRVYDIALETISHGDGRVDPEGLTGFVAAYQTVTALKLGECGPFPSCCAWLSSRTFGAWVRESRRRASIATEPPCGPSRWRR